jgi:hypothetical protein
MYVQTMDDIASIISTKIPTNIIGSENTLSIKTNSAKKHFFNESRLV